MSVYTIGGIKYSSTHLKDIRESSVEPAVEQILLSGSGHIYNTFSGVGKQRPGLGFTTGDIKTALATLGAGVGISFATSELVAWLKKIADGGTIASGSSHVKLTCVKGLIVPQSLSIPDAPGSATIGYRVMLVSADGSTAPLMIAKNQALDASDAGAAIAWILGGVSINGTALTGVSSVSVDFGVGAMTLGGNGKVYDTFSGIPKIAPSITIAARDVEALEGWGIAGVAQSATDSVITITDVPDGGVRGTSPITISIDAGRITTDNLRASDGSPVEHGIRITPTFDGTNLPLAFSGLS